LERRGLKKKNEYFPNYFTFLPARFYEYFKIIFARSSTISQQHSRILSTAVTINSPHSIRVDSLLDIASDWFLVISMPIYVLQNQLINTQTWILNMRLLSMKVMIPFQVFQISMPSCIFLYLCWNYSKNLRLSVWMRSTIFLKKLLLLRWRKSSAKLLLWKMSSRNQFLTISKM